MIINVCMHSPQQGDFLFFLSDPIANNILIFCTIYMSLSSLFFIPVPTPTFSQYPKGFTFPGTICTTRFK